MAKRLLMFSFELMQPHQASEIADALVQGNDERSRFIISDFDYGHLDGYFCTKVERNESVYNFDSGLIEKITVEKILFVQHSIDLDKKVMLVAGSASIISQFITTIAIRLNNRIVLDIQTIDLQDLVTKSISDRKIIIKKAKLSDIPIDGGILASCSIDLSQYNDASVFLKKHSDNISQMSILISTGDMDYEDSETISLTVYRSGNVVLNSAENVLSDVWKQALYGIWGR